MAYPNLLNRPIKYYSRLLKTFIQGKTRWFFQKGYLQGVFWIILVSLISNANDILMRVLSSHLESMQIVFFRFFFAVLILLPYMMTIGQSSFETSKPGFHVIRSLLGFTAMGCWCIGLGLVPLALASTIALTVPLFVLPMAVVFLKEQVGWQRTAATIVGFIGVIVILSPAEYNTGRAWSQSNVNMGALVLIFASILFALSDILNKKMIKDESALTMLFYFALGTSVIGFWPALMVWKMPTSIEYVYLICLGLGSNLILYCLLKAFKAIDVSALAPYRYLELIFAVVFGYILFNEVPGINTLIGAAIIIPCTFAIAYYETHQRREKQQLAMQSHKANTIEKVQSATES